MTLSVSQQVEGSKASVAVTGELDIAGAPDLGDVFESLIDGGVKEMVVDLTGLDFLDSSGLSVILGAHQQLQKQGGTLTLQGPSQYVIKLLEVTHLDQVFEVRITPRSV